MNRDSAAVLAVNKSHPVPKPASRDKETYKHWTLGMRGQKMGQTGPRAQKDHLPQMCLPDSFRLPSGEKGKSFGILAEPEATPKRASKGGQRERERER